MKTELQKIKARCEKLKFHLEWFLKDNDKRQGWDNPGKEDSPEIKEVRELLESGE